MSASVGSSMVMVATMPLRLVRTGQILYRTDRGDGLHILVRLRRRVEGKHALDCERSGGEAGGFSCGFCFWRLDDERGLPHARYIAADRLRCSAALHRSEEHTSELQS